MFILFFLNPGAIIHITQGITVQLKETLQSEISRDDNT